MESLRRSGCEFVISPGDGAFYGPKIEYTLKDAHRPRSGSAARCRSTSRWPSGWAPNTSPRTAAPRIR